MPFRALPAQQMDGAGRSGILRPAKAPVVGHGAHARIAVGDPRVQVGAAPAQRVQAAQHVAADRDVDCAPFEQIELERLAVGGCGKEAREARDLTAVELLGQIEQWRESLSGGLRGSQG